MWGKDGRRDECDVQKPSEEDGVNELARAARLCIMMDAACCTLSSGPDHVDLCKVVMHCQPSLTMTVRLGIPLHMFSFTIYFHML